MNSTRRQSLGLGSNVVEILNSNPDMDPNWVLSVSASGLDSQQEADYVNAWLAARGINASVSASASAGVPSFGAPPAPAPSVYDQAVANQASAPPIAPNAQERPQTLIEAQALQTQQTQPGYYVDYTPGPANSGGLYEPSNGGPRQATVSLAPDVTDMEYIPPGSNTRPPELQNLNILVVAAGFGLLYLLTRK